MFNPEKLITFETHLEIGWVNIRVNIIKPYKTPSNHKKNMCCPVFSPKDLGLGRLGGGQVIKSWKLWTPMELALGAPLRKQRLWTVVAQLQWCAAAVKMTLFKSDLSPTDILSDTYSETFIVDLPINSMVIFHSYVNVYQRLSGILSDIWRFFVEIRQCPCRALAVAKSRGPHLAGDMGKNLYVQGLGLGLPLFNMIPKTVSFSVPWPNSPPCCFL